MTTVVIVRIASTAQAWSSDIIGNVIDPSRQAQASVMMLTKPHSSLSTSCDAQICMAHGQGRLMCRQAPQAAKVGVGR